MPRLKAQGQLSGPFSTKPCPPYLSPLYYLLVVDIHTIPLQFQFGVSLYRIQAQFDLFKQSGHQ